MIKKIKDGYTATNPPYKVIPLESFLTKEEIKQILTVNPFKLTEKGRKKMQKDMKKLLKGKPHDDAYKFFTGKM